jgi:hypothetical protein
MSDDQVHRKNIFNELLQRSGWDIGGMDTLLESDALDVTPEAAATKWGERTNLLLEYNAREEFVALTISDADSHSAVRYRFHCRDVFEEMLHSIVERQEQIHRDHYVHLLEKLVELCPHVYADVNGELVRLKLEE